MKPIMNTKDLVIERLVRRGTSTTLLHNSNSNSVTSYP